MNAVRLDHAASPKNRAESLRVIRNLKMARSAHRYVRGSTQQFYRWLEYETTGRIPEGPAIWICGDCHIGNIGPVGSVDGEIDIEIRDLDQTVIGNPAHDLVRLGLSLAMSIRSSDLPGVKTSLMIEALIAGYSYALKYPGSDGKVLRPASVELALRNALQRRWKHLANERIGNADPSIPLGSRFWPIAESESAAIDEMFSAPALSDLLTAVWSRADDAKVKILDRAYWMKGCSSLGLMRYAVLARIGKKGGKREQLCLIDIKQAAAPLAPRMPDSPIPADNAVRVVTGARALSPQLGGRMAASTLLGKAVFVRELFPQDLKLDLDRLPSKEVEDVARYLAWVVGRAHARQLAKAERLDWLRKIQGRRHKDLAAPSWLWSGVVELVGLHESAYLEHCRSYSLSNERLG